MPGDAGTVIDPEELQRLRVENEKLRALLEQPPPIDSAPRRHRQFGRWTAAIVCLLIGCLLLPVSAVGLWARTIVFNTDRYVETVAPLAHDPAIQDAVAARITDEVFAAIDIDGLTQRALDGLVKQGLPAEIVMLKQPAVNGIKSFTLTQVNNIVASEAFAQAWEQANRAAHTGLVNALKGNEGGAIEVQNGAVTVNLGAFIETIKPKLVEAGIPLAEKIPTVALTFTILRSAEIPKIQRAAGLLDTWALPLALLAFLLLAAGVWLAPNRRRMLAVTGFGIALALLSLLGVLAASRTYYLEHLPPDSIPPDAAGNVWDTLLRLFTARLQAVVVLGVVIGVCAWVVGPGALAVLLRNAGNRLITAARTSGQQLGWQPGATDHWVAAHTAALRAGAVALIVAVYAFWSRPTGAVVIWLALALLVIMGVIELLRRGADLPPQADRPPQAPLPAPPQAAVPAGS